MKNAKYRGNKYSKQNDFVSSSKITQNDKGACISINCGSKNKERQ